MANKMWFGNARGHMQYVPCPLLDSTVTRNRYVERIQFENGGGDARRSPAYQMQYDFAFSGLAHEVDGIDAFNKYAQGFYGDDLIYLAHPANFETNMFPAGWASPSLSEKGWPKISSDVATYGDADGIVYTNLVTNPSMEASSGTVTVRTNLVTNPSMETVASGTVVMRRNLVPNPSFEVDATGWSVVNGTASTIASSPDRAWTGSRSLKFTYGTSTTTDTGPSTPVTLEAGKTYTASAYVYAASLSNITGLRMAVFGTPVSATTRGTATPVAGDWARISVTFTTVAAGTASVFIAKTSNVSASGSVIYVDAVMLEDSSVVGDFFDGSTTDALGWDYAWSGTANASISTAASAATTVRTNLVTNPTAGVNTAGWSGTQTISRVVGTSVLGIGRYFSMTSVGAGNNAAIDFATTVGQTYTLSMYVKSPTVATRLDFRDSAGLVIAVTATNVTRSNWERISVTGVATTTVSRLFLRADGAGEMQFVAALAETGNAVLDVFDGSFTASGDFTYAWSGTAHASTSVMQGATVVGIAYTAGQYIPYQTRENPWIGSAATRNYLIDAGVGVGLQVSEFVPTTGTTYAMVLRARANNRNQVVAPRIRGTVGSLVTLQQGVWTEISIAAVAGSGTSAQTGLLIAAGSGHLAGDTIDIDGVLIEASPIVGAYFDGSVVSADADLTNSWSGTAHASTSLQRGVGVRRQGNESGTTISSSAASIQSNEWSSTGSKSLRVISNSTSTSSFAELTITGNHIPVTPGATYTMAAKIRITAPQTGTLDANARKLSARFYQGSEQLTSIAAPNTAGVHQVSMTFTVPAGRTELTPRLWNGASAGNGEVWWDDLIVVEGNYTGNYFDGSTQDSGNITYAWTGTANASTSTATNEMVMYGNPPRKTTYTVTNINQPPTKVCTLVIPPEYTLYLGASGTSTGTAGVFIRPIQASDSLYYGPTEKLTLLDPNGSVRMNKTLNGATYQAVEIFLMKTDVAAATVTLNSMMSQLYKTGTTPALPTNHYQGEGSTGLMFADDAIVETYSYMHPPRKGIATVLVEVEAWR